MQLNESQDLARIVFVLVCAVDDAAQSLAEKQRLELPSPDAPVLVVELVDKYAALCRHLATLSTLPESATYTVCRARSTAPHNVRGPITC